MKQKQKVCILPLINSIYMHCVSEKHISKPILKGGGGAIRPLRSLGPPLLQIVERECDI